MLSNVEGRKCELAVISLLCFWSPEFGDVRHRGGMICCGVSLLCIFHRLLGGGLDMSSHCGECLIGFLSYGCIRTVSLVMVADSFLSFETGLLFIFIFSRVGFVSCDALRNSRPQELGCTTMSDYGVQ